MSVNFNNANYITTGGVSLDSLDTVRNPNLTGKQQLQKVSKEFEAIFVAKMLSTLDKTVDRENSMFQESKYMDSLKSVMYADIGKNIANSPTTSIGIAKQIYEQMQHTVSD
ncbi:rod-binding protein [bacterium]|nr:rod-binding protein [bacterium]